ncbi:GGDEF domain-containing protein [Sinanaerobacter chloroacetimidivorans]|jgi:diguanylate cyclase (GGDEF)-like protein|nr:GGDEF domain-containing protein [Sinanaerobacter chloroacetimidivorans]
MELAQIIQLNIFSFIILVLIYSNERKMKEQLVTYKIFKFIVKVGMLLLIVDTSAWYFNEKSGNLNLFGNQISNLILYIFAIVPVALWLLYVYFQVIHNRNRATRVIIAACLLVFVNGLLSLMSIKTGWYYSIDSNNVYHRGPYFWVHVLLCYSVVNYTFFFILFNRRKIDKRYYKSLLLFPIPQLVGSALQVAFYGISLNWSGLTISLLIVYFNIQDMGLNTDYLTGVFNRRILDYHLRDKINNTSKNKTFSAILIDLDDFKKINDNFGHHVGDEALQETVGLLKSSLKKESFIARFGGDEFIAVLDIDSIKHLEMIIYRINNNVRAYNQTSGKPYEIKLSMGYCVYDYSSKMKVEEFIRQIDQLMYENKKKGK